MMRHLSFHESTILFFHARDHKEKKNSQQDKELTWHFEHLIFFSSNTNTQRSMAGSAHTDSEAKLSNLDRLQFLIASSTGHSQYYFLNVIP
jgi:hypothetical protein